MGKRANIRATAINTQAIAQSNAELAKQARRDQLEAQGLIDFNVTDGVVRALERRLAMERGEHVAPIGDPAGSQAVAAIGAVLMIVGFGVAFAAFEAGFWVLLIGFLMVISGVKGASAIEQLRNDEAALAVFESSRLARQEPSRAPAQSLTPDFRVQAPLPALPRTPSAVRRSPRRGMRRPQPQPSKDSLA